MLWCVTVCCAMLWYDILCYAMLYDAMQHCAVLCNVMQCLALLCNAMRLRLHRAFCIFLVFSQCHWAIQWPANSQPSRHQPDQLWVWSFNGQPNASHWPGQWPSQYLRRTELNGIDVKMKLRLEFKVSAELELKLEANGQANGWHWAAH